MGSTLSGRAGAVRLLAILLAAATAPGCGGGGGGGAMAPRSVLLPGDRFLEANPAKHNPPGFASRRAGYEGVDEYDVAWINTGTGETGTDGHLRRVKAASAYARGATGDGETIVVVDSGLDSAHREFSGAGKVEIGTSLTAGYTPSGDDLFHGTAVAGVAAANRGALSGLNMHGVAFEARVYAVSLELGGGGGDYTPLDLGSRTASDDSANAADYSNVIGRNKGAIVNFSFGYSGGVSRYDRAALRGAFPATAAALAQSGTRDADKQIVVWSAGNAFDKRLADGARPRADSPEVLAGLGVAFPELRGHVLAVVAVDQDGGIASYSNRCGLAAAFCLAAPGSHIIAPSGGTGDPTDYNLSSGTSLAAPVVSGALALLRHYFRNPDGARALGNTELVRRLLATADRTGRYADEATYGQGLLDLDAATRPVGPLRTSLSSDPASRPLAGTGLDLAGGAFGSRLSEALAGTGMVGFDRLDAPFAVSLAGVARSPAREEGPPETTAAQRAGTRTGFGVAALREVAPHDARRPGELLLSFAPAGRGEESGRAWWLSWGRHEGRSLGLYRDGAAGRFTDRSAFAAPWLALVRDGPGLGTSLPLPDGGRVSLALMRGSPHEEGYRSAGGHAGAGAIAEYRPGDGALSLQAGFVREADGFLGARPRGALGAASASTAFAGFNHREPLTGGWDLLASGWLGWTRPEVRGGDILDGVSRLRSSAFGLGLERRSWQREGDWFGVRLSQPMRVESGSAELRYAVGRTPYREILYERRRVDLASSVRPWQAEAAWRTPLAGGEMSASLGLERSADANIRHGDIEFLGALRFDYAF